jgi:trigger factor
MIDEMLRDLELQVSQIGYKLQDFLRLQGKSLESYHEEVRPAAERRLKGRLALAELAKAEEITVTPEENQAELDRLAGGALDEDRARNIRETLSSESGQWLISRDLRNRKALARLREIATGQVPESAKAGETGGAEAPATEDAAEDVAPSPAEAAPKKKRTKKTS